MLILSRRIGEIVHVGPDITVRVLGIQNGQVKLGFDAPADVNIVRSELIDRDAAAAPKPVKA